MRRIIFVLCGIIVFSIQVTLLKQSSNVMIEIIAVILYGFLFRLFIPKKDIELYFQPKINLIIIWIIFCVILNVVVIIPTLALTGKINMDVIMYVNYLPNFLHRIMTSYRMQTILLFVFGTLLSYSFISEKGL